MWDIVQMRDNGDGTVSLRGSDGTVKTMPKQASDSAQRKVALDKTATDISKTADAILKARRALGKFDALTLALMESKQIAEDSLPDDLKTRRYPSKITVGSRFQFSKKKSTEYAKDDPRNQVSTTGDLFKYKPKSSVRR